MKLTNENAYSDNLTTTDWIGEVVDINDPLKIGRVKIKVFGKFDELDVKFIPWASPMNNCTSGSKTGGSFFSVPKLNSIVGVKFDNGDIYHPQYVYNQKISDEVRDEINDSYENAQVIVYDTVTNGHLKVFFTEKKGLVLSYKDNVFNIKPDDSIDVIAKSNINITTDKDVNVKAQNVIIDSSKKIELGKNSSEPVLLGRTFIKFFNNHIHPHPQGPTQKPLFVGSEDLLASKTVTVKKQ